MKHVMIDLETMGTRAGCAVVSIGAVKFDPEKDPSGEKISLPENRFHFAIDLQTCLNVGLKVQASTLYWWMEQSAEARKSLCRERVSLSTALQQFKEFFEGSEFIWGHGSNFDQPILEAAFAAVKEPPCWKFWNSRDTRTLFDITGTEVKRNKATHHNALSDAEDQALAVLNAYNRLKAWKER